MEIEIHSHENVDVGTRLLNWVAYHQKNIVIGLSGAVALAVILVGVNAWYGSQGNKAQTALFLAADKPEALAKVVQDFPRSQATLLALTDLGAGAITSKNFDASFGHYENLYNKAGGQVYFRVLALHGMAVAQKGKGDFKKAAEYFEKAAGEPGNVASLVSRFEAARALQAAKDPQTETLYQSLLNEKSIPVELKAKIEEQLLWLKLSKKS